MGLLHVQKEIEMPQVSLKEYAASIAQMIQGGNVDNAIVHCRHVLSYYPKYLPAYQLLAHACLEKGDLAHASHFFQCVLSVDPEDADAWMNLALLSDDLGELEQATWLMERAFDVVPGNSQVRNHLRQLYTRRDGIERTRVKLSGGALARLYAVGGFHRKAAEELHKLLQDGTDLPPLHVAQLEVTLARALWHIQGMAPMADQVCQSLTSKLPNCLQANLIMAQIRSSAGREEEAEPYLAVVRSVDPEGSHAFDLLGDRSPVPQIAIEIPYLESEERPTIVERVEAAGPRGEDTSWLDRIGEAIEASPETVSPVSEQALPPVWLKEWTADQAPVTPPASVGLPQEPEPPAEAEKETAVPDWIQGIGVSESVEMAAAEPVAEEDLPDWLRELGTEAVLEEEPGMGLGTLERVEGPGLETRAELPVQGAAAGHEEVTTTAPGPELPEWLQELSVVAPPQGEPELTTGTEQVVTPPAQEKLPDWLAELGADAGSDEQGQPSAVAGVAPQVAGHEELAGWLQELSPEAEEPVESTTLVESTAEPVAEEELPDWLRELRSEGVVEELVSPEERVAVEPATEEELPAWLQELEPQAPVEEQVEPTLVSEVPPQALEEPEPPDWLKELRSQGIVGEEKAITEPAEEERLQRQLGGLGPVGEAEELPESAVVGDGTPEPEAEDEFPAWLRELRSEGVVEELIAPAAERTAAVPTSEEELPGWLRELSPEAEEPVESTTLVESTAEPVAEEELPDWLRELRSEGVVEELVSPEERVAVEPATEEELPAWLQELEPQAPVEEEAEPTLVGEVPPQALEEPEPPDWLRRLGAVDEALQESEPAALGELPMQEEAAPALEPGVEALTEEEIPEWLAQQGPERQQPEAALAGEQAAAEVAPVPEMPERTEGMPSWLAELEAEIAGRSIAAVGEVEPPVVSGVTALPVGLEEQEVAGPPVEQLEEARPPEEAVTGQLLAGEPAVAEEIEPIPAVEMETPLPMAEVPPISTGMPEWLTQLEQELGQRAAAPTYETGEGEELAPAETAEAGLEPSWSEEPIEPAGGALAPGEEAVRAEAAREQPEWLGAPLDGQMSEVTVEEMPEWLRQLHATEAAAEQVEAAEIGPTAEALARVPTSEQGGRPQDLPQTPVSEPEASHPGQAVPGLGLSVEGPLPTMADVSVAGSRPAEESPAQVPQALGYLVEPASAQDDYQARVALARAYVRAGNLDASAQEYEQLAKVPSVSSILVKDLEDLVASHPDHHALHRVLGDAYMRAGRLQDALSAYKEALTRL